MEVSFFLVCPNHSSIKFYRIERNRYIYNFLKLESRFFFSVNVGCGPAEERILLTGAHTVADIYCECCKTTLGWKYVSTFSSKSEVNYRNLDIVNSIDFLFPDFTHWLDVY